MVESVNAYLNAIAGTYLEVSSRSPVVGAGTTSAGRVVEDRVTLSPFAQALLNTQASVNPSSADSLNDPAQSGFISVDFSGQDFSGNDLTGAVLESANLAGTNFSNAVLTDTTLRGSDVTGAVFHGADLRGANLGYVSGLTSDQLTNARVDYTTILPVGVVLE
ncbi:MAG: pentapeptide repeat-containing protein [Rhodospirillales bacterium]|nr:pentapeptide repeat-containing protein [Rhodospirillales bacterium]